MSYILPNFITNYNKIITNKFLNYLLFEILKITILLIIKK